MRRLARNFCSSGRAVFTGSGFQFSADVCFAGSGQYVQAGALSLSTLLEPGTTQEVVVELWDASTGGTLQFSESYTGLGALIVDSSGTISFLFGGLQVPPGLNPDDFPAGSSRYLDVTRNGTRRWSAG
jgi:hypothetical protein